MRNLLFLLLLVPVSLFGSWQGENFIGGTWNPSGLVNEATLSRRISFADKTSFLLSESHLDIGAFVSIFPVGGLFAGRVKFSPFLFLDIGFMAGVHTCWDYYTFPDGTTTYNQRVRDNLTSGSKVLPYISPFWIIKLKFGPILLYNSFYLEKFFHNRLWYYWYPELMVRDGWIFYWNSYTLFPLSPKAFLLIKAHLQKSQDTGDTRFHLGPGVRINAFGKNNFLIASIEYHFKEVNYSGLKLNIGMESSFSW